MLGVGNDCCKPCPTPTDQTLPLPEQSLDFPYSEHTCVDCTKSGRSVDEYGDPIDDHGIMMPRVTLGWAQSLSGQLRSVPGVDPLTGAFGPAGAPNGGDGNIVKLNKLLSTECNVWTNEPHSRDPEKCFIVDGVADAQPGALGTVVELNIFRYVNHWNAIRAAIVLWRQNIQSSD